MLVREATTADLRHVATDTAASSHGLRLPTGTHDATPLSFTISVVIPTKNEARNIGWVLERMEPLVDEIVIVDGLSHDGTIEAALRVRPDAVIVAHAVPGKGEAVRAGFAAATGDLVVMLDADGSMDPAEISTFVPALADGADVAKESRFMAGGGTTDMTSLRKIGNACLVRVANFLLGTSHTELCYGHRPSAIAAWRSSTCGPRASKSRPSSSSRRAARALPWWRSPASSPRDDMGPRT